MKKLLVIFTLSCISVFGQSVTNIRFEAIGDSSVSVLWDTTGTFDEVRLRYGTSQTSGGSGGTVQTVSVVLSTFANYDFSFNLSGLAPNTLYYVSPEVRNGGGAWSSGVSATFTTLARTQVLPTAPTAVPLTFAAQYAVAPLSVTSNCANLQSQINAAIPGDTIEVPAGTLCTGEYTLPDDPAMKSFTPSAVTTTNSYITINSHGFSDNQEVRLASSGCLPGNVIYALYQSCALSGGWKTGVAYYVNYVDANTIQLIDTPNGNPVVPGWVTFTANAATDQLTVKPVRQVQVDDSGNGGYQYKGNEWNGIAANAVVRVYSTGTLPNGLSIDVDYNWKTACTPSPDTACVSALATSSGGADIDLTSAGTGTLYLVDRGTGTHYITAAPPSLSTGPNIVIKTTGALPPIGVRITPEYDSQLFHFRRTTTPTGSDTRQLTAGILTHNWIIRGAIFDTSNDATDYLTQTDPEPFCYGYKTHRHNSNILVDQSRMQGPGYPQRSGCNTNAVLVENDGANVGFINSDARAMDHWHAQFHVGGFVGTSNSTSATYTAGTISTGSAYCGLWTTTGNTVITLTSGGGVSKTALVYLGLDCRLKLIPPTGTTMTCTAGGKNCDVLASQVTPAYPTSSGRRASFPFASVTITAGSISSQCAPDICTGIFSTGLTASEGVTGFRPGDGPGPYVFSNNWISGTGIPIHFDDGGGPFATRSDYTIVRNTFDVPASQLARGVFSDGLRYGHRQSLEWKGGNKIKVDGNIFQGDFAEDNSWGVAIAITPRSSGSVNDFDATNNTFTAGGGIYIPAPISAYLPTSRPSQRLRVANNLFLVNGHTNNVTGVGVGRGSVLVGGYGSENVMIDHNTAYDTRGVYPSFLYWQLHPLGGAVITNNILYYTGDIQPLRGENVSGCGGSDANVTLLNCGFTSGPGVPSYTFTRNLIVPSWTNSLTLSGGIVSDSTVSTQFSGAGTNYVPAGASVAANNTLINYIDVANGRYDLRYNSPYAKVGTDGRPLGVDMVVLKRAQGTIEQVREIAVGTTTASIAFTAPEITTACYAGYGTSASPDGTWTWSAANTAGTFGRSISLTGLTANTSYNYAAACNGTAIFTGGKFRTN